MSSSRELKIAPICSDHCVSDFCCGNEYIDNWCRKTALKDHNKFKSRAFVATLGSSNDVVGIYSLTVRSLQPRAIKDVGFGKRDIPAIYFATLGISQSAQGAGYGSAMMLDAFERTLRIADDVGVYCLWLTAVDQPTSAFYEKLGFSFIDPETADNLDMFIPRLTIADAIL